MNIVESAYGAVPAFRADGLLGGEIELPELLGEVMTRAGIGLILAAHGGEILYANDMANELLRASDGLRCERSSLTIQDTASSRKLQPLILAASRRQEEMASGGTVILRGGGAAPPLVLHVIPLDARFSKDSAAGPQPAAGILIVDGQRAFAARTGAFACLFALTPGEARVAAKLFSGEGIKKAASSLNIALSTAQSHLKHILEKTATHRQAELVKLFYQVTLPAGAARSATLERATGLRASASKALWSGIGRRDRAAAGGPGLRAPFPCRAPLSSTQIP